MSALPDVVERGGSPPTWPSIIPDGATTSAPALGLRDRDRRVPLEGGVVVDLTGVGEQPAVAVVGVLVEAVVGHQHERVADLVAQVAQRDLHDAVGVVGARTAGVLGGGHPEEDHRGHAEVGERPHLLAEALLGVLHDARHRRHRLGRVDALLHEERRDQVVDRDAGLGDEAPEGGGAAEPAHAPLGKGHADDGSQRTFWRHGAMRRGATPTR